MVRASLVFSGATVISSSSAAASIDNLGVHRSNHPLRASPSLTNGRTTSNSSSNNSSAGWTMTRRQSHSQIQQPQSSPLSSSSSSLPSSRSLASELHHYQQSCFPLLASCSGPARRLDPSSYYTFVDGLSNGYFSHHAMTSYDALPIVVKYSFVTLSCACHARGGRQDCCVGDKAEIDVEGCDASRERMAEEVDEAQIVYLMDVCRTTEESVGGMVLPPLGENGNGTNGTVTDESDSPVNGPAGAPVTAAPVANPTKVPTDVPTAAPTELPAPTAAVEIPAITGNDNNNNGNNFPTDSDSSAAIQQPDPNDPSTRGLTGGAYAGIAIGAAAVGTFLLYFLMSRTDRQNDEDVDAEDLDADLERMEQQEVVKNKKNAHSNPHGRPPLSIDTADARGKTDGDDEARDAHSPSNQSHDHTAATAAMTASPSQLHSVPSSSDSISTNPNYPRVGATGSSNFAMPSLLGRPDDQSVLSHSDDEDHVDYDSNSHHRGTARGVDDTMGSEEVVSDAESHVGGSSTGDRTNASGSARGSDNNSNATRVKDSMTSLAALGVATAAVTGWRHPYSSAGGIYEEEDEEDERYIGIGGRNGRIGNNINGTNDSTDEDSSIASISVSR